MAQNNFKKLASEVFDSYQNILNNQPESLRSKIMKDINDSLIILITFGFKQIQANSIYKWANVNKIHTKTYRKPIKTYRKPTKTYKIYKL